MSRGEKAYLAVTVLVYLGVIAFIVVMAVKAGCSQGCQ